jgi:alpha-2-macroglobulin
VKLRVLALVLLAVSCGGEKKPSSSGQAPVAPKAADQDIPEGLDLRLSDGKQGAPAYDRSKLASATKLADADVEALLARAAPLQAEAGDQKHFALRPASQPLPRTGETIKTSFPPPASSLLPPSPTADAHGKDVTVLRWMPEGEVPVAPNLSVTFSQPMVAVTSQDDAAKVQPVKLTPQPKGKWRWIGTRTILFDPDPRFPQATTYKVEIAAGTKSATGGTLKDAHAFTFETPTPTIVTRYPDSHAPQQLDVPIFIKFDQKIDAQAVLAHIKLEVPDIKQTGDAWGAANAATRSVGIRMLDAKELESDKRIKALVEQAKREEQDGRYLVFRAADRLPPDATITIRIPAGMPSAEGPNRTKEPQTFSFSTYPPLRLVESLCNYRSECRPNMPFMFRFNNPLDADKVAANAQLVSVTPAIEGMKVHASGNQLIIYGATKARTSYTVKIHKALTDAFAQTLADDVSHSFTIGDAYPTFYGPNGIVVLDPAATRRTLDFFSTNYESLKVEVYKVSPADLAAFGRYQREQWRRDVPPKLPGTKVFDDLIQTKQTPNELVETSIDLAAALDKQGLGHALVIVQPHPWPHTYRAPKMIAWVQATKLAIDAHVDGENMLAFVTELDGGKPVAGVEVELKPSSAKATTDANGLATIPLSTSAVGAHYVSARRGADIAFVTESPYLNDYSSWHRQGRDRQVSWYVLDDRKLYKPGEQVSLKGWLRVVNYGKHGDVEGLGGGVTSVNYRVRDSRNNELAKGTATVSPVGGWDATFALPSTPNLGDARVELSTTGRLTSYHRHTIQVEEFRRPEFEVSAQASMGPFVIGGSGDVTVSAKYFAGGVLPGADVSWYVSASQTSFTPPNRDDFVFGMWEPWWGYRAWYHDEPEDPSPGARSPGSWQHAGKTDAMGEHVLRLDFLSVKPARPMSVTASATVMDVNRQAWNASSTLVVHPSSVYAGVKTKRSFVEKGKPFEVEVIAVDLDGKAVPGAKIAVTTTRQDWELKGGRYVTKQVDPQTCNVVAKADAVPCSFTTKQGGTYELVAIVTDDKGRANQTKLTFWVSGGDSAPPSREVTREVVQLIPDKKDYTPGNTAELMVQAPFFPAEGIVTWRRSGIVKTERITLTGATTSLKIPIVDTMTPNLHVQVDLVGMAVRANDTGEPDPSLPKRPAYAVGSINLPIPPNHRTLAVTATPAAAKLGPGEQTTVSIEVKDAAGKPLADAEAAVLVVDEAVLALTGHKHPDPIGSFYPQRGSDTRDYYERAYVKLVRPEATRTAALPAPPPPPPPPAADPSDGVYGGSVDGDFAVDTKAMPISAAAPMAEEPESGAMAPRRAKMKLAESGMRDEALELAHTAGVLGSTGKAGAARPEPRVAVRTNFNPLAAFSPSVKTGPDGKATVTVKLPDNLTRYRIVAIAVAGDKQFGKGESAVTARLPLMVRPSPPRFLNFGDTFKLPIVVQNQTDAPMTVRLAARATNAAFTDGAGRQVTVSANDRVEVQLPASADMAGTARFQIVGAAGEVSDAANLELPVWTPATTEAFATYGVIDNGSIAQPVALPGKVWPQFGGLEVTTASTNMQALTDAVIYLVRYPFECAEQRASRILAIAALRDVLTAFKTKDLPSVAAMEHSIDLDIKRLSQMQNPDGGYAFWERGYPSEPYLTVFVTQALLKAKSKRFTVNDYMLQRSQNYLRNIESFYPDYYSEEIRTAISAYALYVRKQMGDLDLDKAKRLVADRGGPTKIQMEANAWLLGVFAGNPAAADERKAILRHALNNVSETAGAANFTTSYGDGAYLLLASNRRVDGIMLESLIQEQKNSDLIPKLVTGLMAHRKRGRWLNTQENAFVLMALDLYFRTYEKTTPNFVARVWLGPDYAGDHAFRGRTTEYHQIDIPMKEVAARDQQPLTIHKDGAGRLYYRIGMKYAPEDLELEPADYGFVVQRRYEAVDDPGDVTRDKDGVWHIKAGARVRIKLNMVNENRRYHVALVDPLPAGLEPMNPKLATTGPLPKSPAQQQSRGRYWWWYSTWYEHQNLRDERVEAFASLLWEGNHEYEYIARATTPGNFVVPPPKAEEMYMPETFGRGASDRVIVE